MELLDLIEQLADAVRFGGGECRADRAGLAVRPQQEQVADLAVLDAAVKFFASLAVTAHQPDADFQALLLGLLGQGQHLAGRRPVDADRLFHEGMQALLDRVGEMHPAKRRRRGEDHHVSRLQAVHGLLDSRQSR